MGLKYSRALREQTLNTKTSIFSYWELDISFLKASRWAYVDNIIQSTPHTRQDVMENWFTSFKALRSALVEAVATVIRLGKENERQ
jgi:hypothetical protein